MTSSGDWIDSVGRIGGRHPGPAKCRCTRSERRGFLPKVRAVKATRPGGLERAERRGLWTILILIYLGAFVEEHATHVQKAVCLLPPLLPLLLLLLLLLLLTTATTTTTTTATTTVRNAVP